MRMKTHVFVLCVDAVIHTYYPPNLKGDIRSDFPAHRPSCNANSYHNFISVVQLAYGHRIRKSQVVE